MARSAQTSGEPIIDPMQVPQSKDAAHKLLESIGYKNVHVFRVEDDRVLFTVGGKHAFTLCLDFDHQKDQVRLRSVEGWPA